MVNVFAVQIFFIVFRECLEAVIIVSVLLSFLKQCLGQPHQDPTIYKRLRKQVWLGSIVGVIFCLIIGGVFIGIFYALGDDIWSSSEDLWEGIFYLIATIIITIMGLALLRINKSKQKWRVKIAKALMERNKGSSRWARGDWGRRYAMFILPFVTTMREGVEAVVFVGGVSLGYPATAFPLPVITGIITGLLTGWLIYRGGNVMSIQIFLIASTCVLYLIAAGMFSKAIWSLQYHVFAVKVGSDVAEVGSGPGSYNVKEAVWHVNCCNPKTDNGWDVFYAILGWQNTGTYGSVISYCAYWILIIACISWMMYEERTGSVPLAHRFWSVVALIPLLRSYSKKKLETMDAKQQDIVRMVNSAMFLESTAAETSKATQQE
ncbi:plasma membrane iron permease [Histoplasma capsulatum G186AR]|uniref:Plasma membrane iron permease n=2 Tax=Ajellomyces capsulatus TaxID=5037 RepID=C0P045_AJECG|nr:plasma membrane iron permease [Histoplasma capsulatum G186AR]EEH02984.1 plasma membrane iron permease [Histoplasma capsulatum G186AR]KAG5296057.1 plasma membrane iron permease [Histoplasma capsulatum]QSS74040.1 plasma membrane iron permease [Histoplasma capsulatum G186AR]